MKRKILKMSTQDGRLIIDDTVYIAVHHGNLQKQHVVEYYGPMSMGKPIDLDIEEFKKINAVAYVYLEKCMELLTSIFKEDFYKEILND